MQTGDTITGKSGTRYLIIKSLGQPGLFGQAFLCHQKPDDTPVVIKTLRRDRVSNSSDRDRFFAEARTLEAVAKAEEQRKVHYAVRLLDESPAGATEPFIVMEQATGQNVLYDILEKVVSWDHAPLEEQRALAIAYHFARALSCAHQAGFCYDDMKLDNLFWREDNLNDPLRIIDWNVTSKVAERGVAGDWKRFGARFYEMRTGNAIGISRDDVVLGERPAGPLWERLPIGIRDIIEKALAGSYQSDEVILRDMEREWQQARMGGSELLGKATAADGEGKVIEVLAPVWRAEQKLNAMDRNAPEREPNLKRCAELRERAEARQGISSNQALESAIGFMDRASYTIARDEFSKIYHNTGKQDPRPRRWFWLSQMALEKPEFYRKHKKDLVAIVEALHKGDKGAMQTAYQSLALVPIDQIPISWLHEEFSIIGHIQDGKFDDALKRFRNLETLFNDYPDLKGWKAELEQKRDDLRKREEAKQQEEELSKKVIELAKEAEEKRTRGDRAGEIRALEKMLEAVNFLLPVCSSEENRSKAGQYKSNTQERLSLILGMKEVEELIEHAQAHFISSAFQQANKYATQALQIIAEIEGRSLDEALRNQLLAWRKEAERIQQESGLEQRIGEKLDAALAEQNLQIGNKLGVLEQQQIGEILDKLEQQTHQIVGKLGLLEQQLIPASSSDETLRPKPLTPDPDNDSSSRNGGAKPGVEQPQPWLGWVLGIVAIVLVVVLVSVFLLFKSILGGSNQSATATTTTATAIITTSPPFNETTVSPINPTSTSLTNTTPTPTPTLTLTPIPAVTATTTVVTTTAGTQTEVTGNAVLPPLSDETNTPPPTGATVTSAATPPLKPTGATGAADSAAAPTTGATGAANPSPPSTGATGATTTTPPRKTKVEGLVESLIAQYKEKILVIFFTIRVLKTILSSGLLRITILRIKSNGYPLLKVNKTALFSSPRAMRWMCSKNRVSSIAYVL